MVSQDKNSNIWSDVATMILRYTSEGMKPFFDEASFVKEKVAALIVAIIKRAWPKPLNNLLQDVMKLASIGEVQREVCIITIRTLVRSNIHNVNKIVSRSFR
jgi:hypothetical protein